MTVQSNTPNYDPEGETRPVSPSPDNLSRYQPIRVNRSGSPEYQAPQQPGQYPPAQQPPAHYPPAPYQPSQYPSGQYPPAQYPSQYIPAPQAPAPRRPAPRRRRMPGCCSCVMTLALPFVLLAIALLAYLIAPFRTDLLVLGIDRVPEGTTVGRSDTMILVSVNPLLPSVKMLSIPRDLWVTIPGVGENRINTAHFFAEAAVPGSGPAAALQTVDQNFGVTVPYYIRLRFDAVLRVVDSLGGVEVNLPNDMGGLTAGSHHLDGTQALAFIRDRKGTDDFFRMEQAQVMLKAIAKQMLSPLSWPRLPQAVQAAMTSVDTNVPFWLWPRLGLAFVRAAIADAIDARTIRREMTTPYITDQGANVLLPDWNQILPYVQEMFP